MADNKNAVASDNWMFDALRHCNFVVTELKDHDSEFSVLATIYRSRWKPLNRWLVMVADSSGRIGCELATFRFSAVRRAKRIARYFLAHQGECLDGGEL